MPRLHSIVLFCRDPYVMATFWATALGLEPVPEDTAALASRTLAEGESVLLKGPGHPDVWVSPVDRLDPPGNRLHLDLAPYGSDTDDLVAAGARVVREEERWTVLADPEGNELCLLRADPA